MMIITMNMTVNVAMSVALMVDESHGDRQYIKATAIVMILMR